MTLEENDGHITAEWMKFLFDLPVSLLREKEHSYDPAFLIDDKPKLS